MLHPCTRGLSRQVSTEVSSKCTVPSVKQAALQYAAICETGAIYSRVFNDGRAYKAYLPAAALQLVSFPAGSARCARICWATTAIGVATGCSREVVQKLWHLMNHQLRVGCTSRHVTALPVKRGSIGSPQVMRKRTYRLASWRSRHSMTGRHISVQSGARFKSLMTKGKQCLGVAIRVLSMSASL